MTTVLTRAQLLHAVSRRSISIFGKTSPRGDIWICLHFGLSVLQPDPFNVPGFGSYFLIQTIKSVENWPMLSRVILLANAHTNTQT